MLALHNILAITIYSSNVARIIVILFYRKLNVSSLQEELRAAATVPNTNVRVPNTNTNLAIVVPNTNVSNLVVTNISVPNTNFGVVSRKIKLTDHLTLCFNRTLHCLSEEQRLPSNIHKIMLPQCPNLTLRHVQDHVKNLAKAERARAAEEKAKTAEERAPVERAAEERATIAEERAKAAEERAPEEEVSFTLYRKEKESIFQLIGQTILQNGDFWSDPASAFSLGISGPKEWLKDQKKKSSRFLLAPIDASREALRSAYLSVTSEKYDYTDKDLENLQNLFKSSARDCVPKERSSLVAFQSKTGVEVCTFKLVVKNAASLLDDKDPLKLEAENILSDLVRSFGSLIVLTNGIDMNLPSDRKKIADAVMEAISYLDKFEEGVKNCLEI